MSEPEQGQVLRILRWSGFVFVALVLCFLAYPLGGGAGLWGMWGALVVVAGMLGASFCAVRLPKSASTGERRLVGGYIAGASVLVSAAACALGGVMTSSVQGAVVGAIVGATATLPYALILTMRFTREASGRG